MPKDQAKLNIMMLSALEALYLCRKTTLAAEKLGLAQPSLSVYLRQLRELTGDTLFIRTSKGLEPTAFCHAYYPAVKEILAGLERLAAPKNPVFDPATTAATFPVAVSFIKGRLFFDRIAVRLMKKYPALKIDMIYAPEAEALRGLETGEADIFIGMVSEKLEKHFSAVRLLGTDLVVLCSAKSPYFRKGRLSRAEYLDTPHIKAAASFAPSLLDAKFRRQGLLQKKLVSVPDVAAEIALLRETDFLLVIDRSDAEFVIGEKEFRILKTDFAFPQFDFHCVWHSRKNGDPAHRWLRDRIAEIR